MTTTSAPSRLHFCQLPVSAASCLLSSSGSLSKKSNTRREKQLNPSSWAAGIAVASESWQVRHSIQRIGGFLFCFSHVNLFQHSCLRWSKQGVPAGVYGVWKMLRRQPMATFHCSHLGHTAGVRVLWPPDEPLSTQELDYSSPLFRIYSEIHRFFPPEKIIR